MVPKIKISFFSVPIPLTNSGFKRGKYDKIQVAELQVLWRELIDLQKIYKLLRYTKLCLTSGHWGEMRIEFALSSLSFLWPGPCYEKFSYIKPILFFLCLWSHILSSASTLRTRFRLLFKISICWEQSVAGDVRFNCSVHREVLLFGVKLWESFSFVVCMLTKIIAQQNATLKKYF